MVLRVVTDIRVLRPLVVTAVGIQVSDECTQQSGFTNPAGADDGHPFTDFNLQVQAAENRIPAKPPGQSFNFKRPAIQFLVLAKTDIGADATGGFDLFQLNFIDLTSP